MESCGASGTEHLSDLKVQAEILVQKLEEGDLGAASSVIQSINAARDRSLYQEVGRLTRGLHDAIVNFQIDTGDNQQASRELSEMADASERLNYVIKMTEKSADKTMDMVEAGMPISTTLGEEAAELQKDWQRLLRREMEPDEFRGLYKRIDAFLQHTVSSTHSLNENFTNILLAQDFQDLTGQVITKVINLVHDVEVNLVSLVKLASEVENITGIVTEEAGEGAEQQEAAGTDIVAEGPQIHAEEREDVVSGQDDVDDLLSSLGF